jgi:hypothetical protein
MMAATMLKKEQMCSKKKTGLRRCANVVRIAMPSVLGMDDGSHHAEKEQMWCKKKMGIRRWTNVVRIAMPSVFGF